MRTVFRALLHLYPQRHREVLGPEMQAVFENNAQEHRLRGSVAYVRFVLVELGGLILHAVIAQFVNITQKGYLENRASFPTTSVPPDDLPEEVLQAQNRVAVSLDHLSFAISRHQFVQACFYSNEERKARENLRQMREKYGIGGPMRKRPLAPPSPSWAIGPRNAK